MISSTGLAAPGPRRLSYTYSTVNEGMLDVEGLCANQTVSRVAQLASHRWRGGHASAVAETRRNMISALVEATGAVLSLRRSRRSKSFGTGTSATLAGMLRGRSPRKVTGQP